MFVEVWRTARERSINMVRQPALYGWDWLLLTLGLYAVLMDALTTFAMVQADSFSEANPSAASLMNVMGLGPYIVGMAAVSLLLTGLVLARRRSLLGAALFTFAVVFIGLKTAVAFNNLSLYVAMGPGFG